MDKALNPFLGGRRKNPPRPELPRRPSLATQQPLLLIAHMCSFSVQFERRAIARLTRAGLVRAGQRSSVWAAR